MLTPKCTKPGQAFRGHLSEHQTSKMHLVAARGPAENARRIVGGARKVIGVHGNNPILAAFGVGVDPKMIVIKGRCLQAPSLQLRQLLPGPSLDSASSIPISITPTAASWNLIGRQLAKPVPIKNWSILRLGGARFEKKYIDEFRQSLTACGLGKVDPLNPQGFQAPLPGSEDANDAEIEKIFRTM